MTTVWADGPPTAPVPLDAGAWNEILKAAGYVEWACVVILIAGVMLIGAMLTVDNRLVDQYGPSIQSIAIKVIVGCVIVAAASEVAQLFT